MSQKMKAVGIKNGKGPASALFIEEVDKPKPKDGQVLVKVKAFGLNRMDLSQREGNYPVPPQAGPILGVEFSGIIEDLSTCDFNKGDEVFGLAYGGAYAEYIAVSVKMIVHKPKELSWETAAGVPEVWFTAIQALYLVGNLTKGQTVLFHAGASAVGQCLIQLAKAEGAACILATAGTDEKTKLCEELGATKGINYKKTKWEDEVKNAAPEGVDLIVDFILGQGYLQSDLAVAKRDATIVLLAMMGGKVIENFDAGAILFKRLTIRGSTLRSRDTEYQAKLKDQFLEHALPHILNGDFQAKIDRVLDWNKIREAHEAMERNEIMGKIICTISS